MKRFRLYLNSIITLFVLGVIGAGLASLFFDLNNLKPMLEETVLEATGRKLSIDGDIELSLFPRPRATASRIRLLNTSGGSESDATTIKIASAQVAWFPLLVGRFDVRQIHASGVRVLVDGAVGDKGLFVFAPPKGALEINKAPLPNLISVINLSVVLRSGAADKEFSVSRFVLRPQGNDGPTAIAITLDRNGTGVTAKGRVGNLNTITGPGPFPFTLATEAAGRSLPVDGALSNIDGNFAVNFFLPSNKPSWVKQDQLVRSVVISAAAVAVLAASWARTTSEAFF